MPKNVCTYIMFEYHSLPDCPHGTTCCLVMLACDELLPMATRRSGWRCAACYFILIILPLPILRIVVMCDSNNSEVSGGMLVTRVLPGASHLRYIKVGAVFIQVVFPTSVETLLRRFCPDCNRTSRGEALFRNIFLPCTESYQD